MGTHVNRKYGVQVKFYVSPEHKAKFEAYAKERQSTPSHEFRRIVEGLELINDRAVEDSSK